MEWQDSGILLGVAPYGEKHAIGHVFTESHGPARGMVYRRHSSGLMPGMRVQARWRGRLPEQLGTLTLETEQPGIDAARLSRPEGAAMISCLARLLYDTLPPGAPHAALYAQTLGVLESNTLAAYARWECQLLSAIGYGLDFSECALTGEREDLSYVSPRTGRAVTALAAAPWREKLLPLPAFLQCDGLLPSRSEITEALRLTAHFLRQAVYAPMGKALPTIRQRLVV